MNKLDPRDSSNLHNIYQYDKCRDNEINIYMVYVLRLSPHDELDEEEHQYYYYVGITKDINKRAEHYNYDSGSQFAIRHTPDEFINFITGIDDEQKAEYLEDCVTGALMNIVGPDKVRGGRAHEPDLSPSDIVDLFNHIES